MKKILNILLSVILCVVLFSCEKKEEPAKEKAIRNMAGQYRLTGMTFLGDPVDLNKDGISNTDLFEEFKENPGKDVYYKNLDSVECKVNAYRDGMSSADMEFSLSVPSQYIEQPKADDEHSLPRYRVLLQRRGAKAERFSYFVSSGGTVSLAYLADNNVYGSFVSELYTRFKEIKEFIPGKRISFVEYTMYYDFKTDKIVKGETLLVYEKIK